MKIVSTITLPAEPTLAFRVLTGVEHWPAYTPRLLWVRHLGPCLGGQLLEMAVHCGRLTLHHRVEQRIDASWSRVYYQHVHGLCAGMTEVWTLAPQGDALQLTVEHTLSFTTPGLKHWPGNWLLGHFLLRPFITEVLTGLRRSIDVEARVAEHAPPPTLLGEAV